jgi:pimeloyl-ACP methyl ester carboxylesterase
VKKRDESVSDFCFINGREDARLSDVERLTMVGGGGLDRAVSRLSKGLSSVTLHQLAPSVDLQGLKSGQERLHGLRSSGVLREIFSIPPSSTSPQLVPVHGFPSGSVTDLVFDSAFPPEKITPDLGYPRWEGNRTSWVRFWEHSGDPSSRQTIVAIHGWTMGDQRVNSLAFLPGLFYSLGWNVALVELPFHGRRVDPTSRDPLFPSVDPVKTCVGMAHALYDLRKLTSYLRSQGHARIACVSLSLGAYVGQLWAALEKLDKAVFIVPLVSMGDLAWDLVRSQKEVGVLAHNPELTSTNGRAFLRDLFRDHCSLGRTPLTPEERMLTIGGRGDQVVSRSQMDLLRKNWPHSQFIWLSGGHGAHLKRGEAFQLVREFLVRTT